MDNVVLSEEERAITKSLILLLRSEVESVPLDYELFYSKLGGNLEEDYRNLFN
jgi:hypothetical protein